MIDLFSFLGGAFTDSSQVSPSPSIIAELHDISFAFEVDYSGIRLLPHELRQLKRIGDIARRDKKTALAALRVFKQRATAFRRALRLGIAPPL